MLDDHFSTIVLRILTILLLSGLIGFEREIKNHSAGFRTHILVGIGSCLMMLLSIYGFEEYRTDDLSIRFDPARIPSYVISGIGFLGAGTIIVYGGTIRGLTTAASIWTVAGLGLIVGIGMYSTAIFATIVILLSLIFLNNFEKVFIHGRGLRMIEIVATRELKLADVISVIESFGVKVEEIEMTKVSPELQRIYIKTEYRDAINQAEIISNIMEVEEVKTTSQRA